jgi:hypothetical protein
MAGAVARGEREGAGVAEKDYSGTPLPRKLGIKEGSIVAFVNEPSSFGATLGRLPPDTEVRSRARGPLDVIVYFTTRASELRRRFGPLARSLAPSGGLWVAYPKKGSGLATDLSFQEVQSTGLDTGLVDNKSCAIDDVWTALRFVVRSEDRPD